MAVDPDAEESANDDGADVLARPAPSDRAVDRMQEALIARFGAKQKTVDTQTLPGDASEAPDDADPSMLGRFEVRGRLGAGAMGVVYEAFDPKLDRRVAVKLLQPHRASPEALARVYREAQALAQLSHPNVVQVFAIGKAGEDVYVAMELIDGQTLREWQAARTRSWQDVLAAYRQAGEGLCAIHDAGLVHRDFKPANVMKDEGGRVRVLDLGLVRGGSSEEHAEVSAAGVSLETSASGSRTRTDALMGTPAYMAPEQFLGAVATAASDQFSFCVAVFEALYGYRPFKATTPVRLMEAVVEGNVEPPPPHTEVPARVHAVLRRGLSHRAGDRYASVRELLAAWEPPAPRRGLRWGAVALGVVAAGLTAYAFTPQTAPCAGVAQLDEIWSAGSRSKVEGALSEAGAAARMASLEVHAGLLREQEEAACRGAAVNDTLLLCRTSSLQRFAAVVDLLGEGSAEVVAHAASVIESLEPPECDAGGDEAVALDEAKMEQAALAVRLGQRAKALALASRLEEAAATVEDALVAARRSTDPKTLSEALRERGMVRIREGDLSAAQPDFEAAYEASLTGKDDRGAAMAALGLTWVSLQRREVEDALLWVRRAESSAKLAPEEQELEARLQQRLGQVYLAQGDVKVGGEHLERSLAIYEALGDQREVGTLLSDLQPVAMSRGDVDGALRYAQRAVQVYEDAFGPDDVQLGTVVHNLGNAWQSKGDNDRSYAAHLRGLKIREAALGPKHGLVGISSYAVATDLASLERFDEALAALARVRECLPAEHPAVTAADLVEGQIETERGNLDSALRLTERALVTFETSMGAQHPNVAEVRLNKARLLRLKGKFDESLAEAKRASAVLLKAHGADHPMTGKAAGTEAKALKSLGKSAEALLRFREAMRVVGAVEGETSESVGAYQTYVAQLLIEDQRLTEARAAAEAAVAAELKGAERAEACFVLARVLRRQGEDSTRQQTLAGEARALWTAAGETDELEVLEAWRKASD